MGALRGEEGCAHVMFGACALVLILVVVLILSVASAVSLPAPMFPPGYDLTRATLLLLLAIVIPAAAGALLANWPVQWPFIRSGQLAIQPDQLTDPELRRTFQRIFEYRQGIAEAARSIGNDQICRLLRELLRESAEPARTLFRLAKEMEDSRQNRLLRGDLSRLCGRTEPLSVTEREQLASLERLYEYVRLTSSMIDEAQAILGRCYAQTREILLTRGLAAGEAQSLMNQLREQAALLGHLAQALRDLDPPR